MQITSSDDRSIKIFSCHEPFQLVERKQLFGHTSRVFGCKIIRFDGKIHFLSVGEDSNLCVWNESGELLCKKNVSASGIIWNLDYSAKLETIVTCSSTGKLNKFCLREILFETHHQEMIDFDDKIHAAKLKYLANGSLVVLDSSMELHMKRLTGEWIRVDYPQNQQKFVAIEAFKNRIFLAAKSSVVVFDFSADLHQLTFTRELEIEKLLPRPIAMDYLRSVHAISINEVFISDASGLCLSLDVNLPKVTNLFQLPKSAEPWTTSVAKVEDFWLIADRNGNLFLYKCNQVASDVSSPVQKLSKLHGNLGVTTIKVDGDGFISTIGNDGTLKTLFLNPTRSPATLEVHRSEKTSVNWIERMCEWNGRNYLLGFNDNYFVINHHRQIIYEHRCGGRHRHWDVTLLERKKVRLTYIQKKKVKSVEFMLSDCDLDDDVAWHTKECNVMEAVDGGGLLISGGEDTLVKLTKLKHVDGEPNFQELASVNSHISNVKTVATFRDGDDLWIFSAGGRAQIVVTRLMDMKHVKEEVNFMLTNSPQSGNSKDSTFDPETRFTSIVFDDQSRRIFVACSDGFVRILQFRREENSCALKLLTEHFYGKCVLKIHVLDGFILTMGTDGIINFWRDESSPALTLIDELKHNQSGINCFDVFKCGDNRFLLGTSGDDAGIFVTEFTIDDAKINFVWTLSSYDVHISQVTGFKFTSRSDFYTTSVDQTVCKLAIEDSAIKVIDRRSTCISDVKGFLFLDEDSDNQVVVVYGAGLEVLRIK